MKLCVEACSLGYAAIATNDREALFHVELGTEAPKLFDSYFSKYPEFVGSIFTPPEPEIIDKTLAIINGEKNDYTTKLELSGTSFQLKVWAHLMTIKIGQTISYKDLAIAIDAPRSHRAVANACGQNQLAIIIPCHRVITSTGGLGGYRWGTEIKQKLLDREKSFLDVI